MILENVLIGGGAKIKSARGHLFVEAKDQNGLGKINVLKHNLVSGRRVGHGVDQLQASDPGKFHPGFGRQLSLQRGRKPNFLQTHFEFLKGEPVHLVGGGDSRAGFSKNVILLVEKGETNVHFAQTIQREEPGNVGIVHKVAAEIEGKLKHGEKIKVEGGSLENVSGVVFPRLGGRAPLIFLLRKAIGRMSRLRAKKFFGVRIHVRVEHRVQIGRDESLLVGAGDALVVVKHVHRFDEHFEPIVLQHNVGHVRSLGLLPIARGIFLDVETTLDGKFSHGTKQNRLGG